jgi:hypothetical protein
MPRFPRSLFGQVVIGVILGLVSPEFAARLNPLGNGFIKLINVIIPVLVFGVVVRSASSPARTRSRTASSAAPGTRTGVRSLDRRSRASSIASRPAEKAPESRRVNHRRSLQGYY